MEYKLSPSILSADFVIWKKVSARQRKMERYIYILM